MSWSVHDRIGHKTWQRGYGSTRWQETNCRCREAVCCGALNSFYRVIEEGRLAAVSWEPPGNDCHECCRTNLRPVANNWCGHSKCFKTLQTMSKKLAEWTPSTYVFLDHSRWAVQHNPHRLRLASKRSAIPDGRRCILRIGLKFK